jgi:hypothetical protein
MADKLPQVLARVDSFDPADAGWRALDDLLGDLFSSPSPESGIDSMLRVLERFPEGDGQGVLWSLVHGLESLPSYESALVASVRRQPTELNVVMVNRLINGGYRFVGTTDLLDLFVQVQSHPNCPESVRTHARDYRQSHLGR